MSFKLNFFQFQKRKLLKSNNFRYQIWIKAVYIIKIYKEKNEIKRNKKENEIYSYLINLIKRKKN